MKKYAVVLAVLVALFIFASVVSVFSNDIVWDDIGRGSLNLRTALVNPDNPQIIYTGSSNAVLKSKDGGVIWRNILSIRGQNRDVNFLLFDHKDKDSLYAATGNGLFFSSDQGEHWKKIFRGKNYLESECTALAISPIAIYVGTKAGLFVSKDKGRSWQRELGRVGSSYILAITYNFKEPNYIYVVSVVGVFKTKDAGQSWERIFVTSSRENSNDIEENTEDKVQEGSFFNIRYIAIDSHNLNYLYLATSRGVYKSQERGQTWELLPNFGLLEQDIRFILISNKSKLYALTKSGIFEHRDDRWYELSLGLVAQEINSLSIDNQGILYAATDKGLFKASAREFSSGKQENIIALYYKDEPTINAVQQAAIKYAEVEPEKILRWRKQAKMKAILPKLTVGLDRSERTNYEIYTSATTRYVYEGPHDKSDGWDVTLSWDLGELVWNDDQTNIDVRSRLMVQLRDDILDEVTKLYFERVRVKMELDELSIEDRKKRFEKELRLQELTASLDALTGGYFSQQLKP